MKTSIIKTEWSLYLWATVITAVILTWFLASRGFEFSLPRVYELDALYSGTIVKTIIETGWYMHNPFLSAPLVYNLADYPSSDSATYLIIKGLAVFNQHYAIVMNAYYFLTFPLVTLLSLFTFRKLGLNKMLALVASVLFAFLPYHLQRNEYHLLLCSYYVIPIYVLMMFAVYSPAGLFTTNHRFSWLKCSAYVLACLFAASSGVYYAFFACYFLLMAGIITSLNLKQWQPMIKAGVLILFISLSVGINLLQHHMNQPEAGPNKTLTQREASETENYALKISQLLLPVDGHRVGFLREFKNYYNGSAPLINENKTATLGIVGSIGFLLLLLGLFFENAIFSGPFLFVARLNIAGVLFGTMGGLSSLFAYTITPIIRSYNRISVFIAFFALFAFFYVLQALLKKYKTKTTLLIVSLLLVMGILDEIPSHGVKTHYPQLKQEFVSDEKFVSDIEHTLPANAMVFQLPAAGFPENPVIFHMTDYQLVKGYLHSHQLRWSYGAIKGRELIAWQQMVSHEATLKMVDDLVLTGFSGLYIDRDGYADNGAQLQRELSKLLKEKPLESDNKKYLFFDLRTYGGQYTYALQHAKYQRKISY